MARSPLLRQLVPAPARRLVRRVLDRARPDAAELAARAEAASAREEWRAAAAHWAKAIAVGEADVRPEWHVNQGDAFEHLENWAGAVRAYRAAVATGRPRPSWHARLGRALEKAGYPGEAVAAYRTAIDQRPEQAKPLWYLWLGRASEKAEGLDRTVEVYSEAREVLGETAPPELFVRLSTAQRRRRAFVAADEAVARGRTLHPSSLALAYEAAEVAMARRDWQCAVDRWEEAMGLVDGEPSYRALVRMAIAYRETRADGEAEALVRRALAQVPDDPAAWHALAEIEHRRLVRAEEVGGLASRQGPGRSSTPAWAPVVERWREVAQRTEGGRRDQAQARIFRSRLFLAEELWTRGNPDAAGSELAALLDQQCGHVLDPGARAEIIEVVSEIRASGQLAPSRSAEVEQLVRDLDPVLLSVDGWLQFYELLLWNNLLAAAAAVRAQAVARAHQLAIPGENVARGALNRAVRAAIESGDFEAGGEFLDRLCREGPSPRTYDHMRMYYLLNRGDRARASGLASCSTPPDERFAQLVRGRSVAVVGPAPSGAVAGPEIDGFDVVVRCNFRGADRLPDAREFGSKTDISYYNVSDSRALEETGDHTVLRELDFAVAKSIGFDFQKALHGEGILRVAPPNWTQLIGAPNSIPVALLDILPFEPARLKIFHANLFLSKEKHFQQYRPEGGGESQQLRRKLRFDLHDPLSQLALTRNLWQSGMVEVDERLAEVLALTDAGYMKAMEDTYLAAG